MLKNFTELPTFRKVFYTLLNCNIIITKIFIIYFYIKKFFEDCRCNDIFNICKGCYLIQNCRINFLFKLCGTNAILYINQLLPKHILTTRFFVTVFPTTKKYFKNYVNQKKYWIQFLVYLVHILKFQLITTDVKFNILHSWAAI